VSSTHLLQGIFSSWNKDNLCSPGARKFSLSRASIDFPYSKWKIFPAVNVCCSLVLIKYPPPQPHAYLFPSLQMLPCSCKPTWRLPLTVQVPRLFGTRPHQDTEQRNICHSVNKRYHKKVEHSSVQYICGYLLLYPYPWNYWHYTLAGVLYRSRSYCSAYSFLLGMQSQ